MKNSVLGGVCLSVSLLVSSPSAAQAADAVVTWNENAAKAATAACLHISGNGLVESRMYAMVHVAIHDAVNAIDRRSRPYAFDAQAGNPTSVDAAVAAAARAALVSVIADAARVAGVPRGWRRQCRGLVCRRTRGDTEWASENERPDAGAGSRSRNHRVAGRRRIGCADGGSRLSTRDRTG